MRTLLLVAVAALSISIPLSAQRGGGGGAGRGGRGGGQQAPAPPRPGLECVEQLSTPEYPMTALEKNVDGSVWTTIQLGPQASVEKVDTQVVSAYSDANKLLVPAVEKAVHATRFKSDCAGKTVFIAFRYQEAGAPVADPKPTSTQDPPNVVFIDSHPPLAKTSTTRR